MRLAFIEIWQVSAVFMLAAAKWLTAENPFGPDGMGLFGVIPGFGML